MSLLNLQGYIDIFLNSCKMIKNSKTATETRNLNMMRYASAAMLIENGLSYRLNSSRIIISAEDKEESFPIKEVYNFMSQNWQERLKYESEAERNYRAMLPPVYNYGSRPAEAFAQQETIEHVSNKADIYGEHYIEPGLSPVPEDDEYGLDIEFPENVAKEANTVEAYTFNKQPEEVGKSKQTVIEQFVPEEPSKPVVEDTVKRSVDEINLNTDLNVSYNKADDNSVVFTVENKIPSAKAEPAGDAEQNTTILTYMENNQIKEPEKEQEVIISPVEEPEENSISTQPQDQTKIYKQDMTFEFTQLKILDNQTGKSETMVAIAFPVYNDNSPYLVANFARQGSDPVPMCGKTIDFAYEGTAIHVNRNSEEKFGCDYSIADPRYTISRLKTKKGGDGGNFVIYDEGLELHAYPLSTKNTPNDEAPFIYYMVIDGYSYLSSTKLYEPLFTYKGKKYKMSVRWLKDEDAAMMGVIEK